MSGLQNSASCNFVSQAASQRVSASLSAVPASAAASQRASASWSAAPASAAASQRASASWSAAPASTAAASQRASASWSAASASTAASQRASASWSAAPASAVASQRYSAAVLQRASTARQSALASVTQKILASRACATPVASGYVSSATAAVSAAASRSTGLSRSTSFAGSSTAARQQSATFQSAVEQAVITARQPLPFENRQQVQAGQYRGLHLNKEEEDSFSGPQPLSQYRINEDPNPEVLRKSLQAAKYIQEIAIRRLNPPPAPKPGDLIIREVQQQVPSAPPVIIRQEGKGAQTPAPLVLRQAPPQPPARIPEHVVEVEGAPVAPPARRVVVEKLPDVPAKPQNILIEKWLPYGPQKRRVVFERSCVPPPQNPRNLIIEWQQCQPQVEQVCKDLGVVDADPEEYRRQYGTELKQASELPNLCQDDSCQAPAVQEGVLELEGDVDALRRVDLEKNGLADYRRYFQ